MPTNPNRSHNIINKSHVIQDISYSQDWLLCVCGWEGKAYSVEAFRNHQKTSEPFDGHSISKQFEGRFNRSFSPLNDAKELTTAKI